MNVYEQQARALKEIAAELKGIRRALDIIGKSLKTDGDQAEERESPAYICKKDGFPCIRCVDGLCSFRKEAGAGNG